MKLEPYAYWTVHLLDIWIKVDQLDGQPLFKETRTTWLETTKIQNQLTTTCNKNEQKQGDKNNADL